MPVGRKPKPTHLRALEGNPGKRPLNDAEPVAAPASSLKAPSELDAYGRTAWRRNAPKLQAMGLLADADLDMLMLYCDAYSQWRHALDMLKHLDGPEPDARAIREAQITREKARADMRLIAGELGLSASSRTRLSVAKPRETDPMEDLLDGRRRA